jgi:RNA polymerase primary sigma factor
MPREFETRDPVDEDDMVRQYIRDASQTPLLDKEEEVWLSIRMQTGKLAQEIIKVNYPIKEEATKACLMTVIDGSAAREHMIKANTALVVSIAKDFLDEDRNFLDLIQDGNEGLIKAADGFDHKRGYKFSSYASTSIRRSIKRGIAENNRAIRVPVHIGDEINEMYRIQFKLGEKLGRKPTPEEIAKELNTTPQKARKLIELSQHPIELEKPTEEGRDNAIGDFIENHLSPNPVQEVNHTFLKEHIAEALSLIPEREAQTLRLRYGLIDGRIFTLKEVSQIIGVTDERVRQLEHQALERMHKISTYAKFREYKGSA